MVDRCIVVDLDHTLIRANSTNLLTTFMLKRLLRRGKLFATVDALWRVGLRKFRIISHKSMKHRLIWIFKRNLTSTDLDELVDQVFACLNERLAARLSASTDRILIATAAADMLMPGFMAKLPFKADYIASRYVDSSKDYHENHDERKLRSVINYLEDNNLEISEFYTDHHADLPLLKYNKGENFLVDPTPQTVAALREASVSYRLF